LDILKIKNNMGITLETALVIANNYPDRIRIESNQKPDLEGFYGGMISLLNEDGSYDRDLISGGRFENAILAREGLEILCQRIKEEYTKE
jgi:hypothetical protein